MDWEAQHKAINTRNSAQTPMRKLVGENSHFWAQFNRENAQKLKDLTDCLVFDARGRMNITWEQESYIRLAYKMLLDCMKNTQAEEELIEKQKKSAVDNDVKRAKLRAVI